MFVGLLMSYYIINTQDTTAFACYCLASFFIYLFLVGFVVVSMFFLVFLVMAFPTIQSISVSISRIAWYILLLAAGSTNSRFHFNIIRRYPFKRCWSVIDLKTCFHQCRPVRAHIINAGLTYDIYLLFHQRRPGWYHQWRPVRAQSSMSAR